MSYCRWHENDSDAYLYAYADDGFSLNLLDTRKVPHDQRDIDDPQVTTSDFTSRQALLEAMTEARAAGYRIPQPAFDRLHREIAAEIAGEKIPSPMEETLHSVVAELENNPQPIPGNPGEES